MDDGGMQWWQQLGQWEELEAATTQHQEQENGNEQTS